MVGSVLGIGTRLAAVEGPVPVRGAIGIHDLM